jgi:hypothetical protein
MTKDHTGDPETVAHDADGSIDDDHRRRGISRRGILTGITGLAAIGAVPATGAAGAEPSTRDAAVCVDVAAEHIYPAYQVAISPDPDVEEVKQRLQAALDALDADEPEVETQ